MPKGYKVLTSVAVLEMPRCSSTALACCCAPRRVSCAFPDIVCSGPRTLAPAPTLSASESRAMMWSGRTKRGIKALDVGEETSGNPVLLVELDGALEDLVGEGVALGEVLGGDFAERAV